MIADKTTCAVIGITESKIFHFLTNTKVEIWDHCILCQHRIRNEEEVAIYIR